MPYLTPRYRENTATGRVSMPSKKPIHPDLKYDKFLQLGQVAG
jgi:hypothetical protein